MPNQSGSGHYEYAEFAANLGNQVVDKSANFTLSGGSPDQRITDIVEKAIRDLLNEKSREGWEPTEPITADHLWRAGKVDHKTTNHIWSGAAKHVLYQVRLGFRRWVIVNANASASVSPATPISREVQPAEKQLSISTSSPLPQERRSDPYAAAVAGVVTVVTVICGFAIMIAVVVATLSSVR